ncbi:MAG TPA: sugar ABC transporter permease [Actinopolymorphaceae bacterium]
MRTARRPFGGFAGWAILPFAAFLAVFAVYPLAQLVRMAFSDVQLEQGLFTWSFAGVANFVRLLDDPIAVRAVVVTTIFTVSAVPASIVLGTLAAVLVDRSTLFTGLARNVILWPAVIAPVVVSLMWLLILSPNLGALNNLLATLGLPGQGWLGSPTGAMGAIIAVDVWHWTPVVFLIVYTALRGMDADVLAAARVDGASERQLLWHIVIPLLRPALVAAALIRLVMCVKAFDEVYLLTRGGPGSATTLVTLHIRNVFFDRVELGYGASYSVVIVAVVAAVLALWAAGRRWVIRANGNGVVTG